MTGTKTRSPPAAARARAGTTAAREAPKKAARPVTARAGSEDAAVRIDRLIAGLADWRGATLAGIRRVIREVEPGVIEEWKWMGTPVWSHGGMVALANAHKDKVKLTFFHGARLRDPHGLFNAGLGGNRWRAIDFRQGDAVDTQALRALLREAIDYNATHAVPGSRGSRR
ncbi:DUF1801 domain-containing protein [Vulcaniibacterium thermophilum]|uniref:YdhG-like domain-containing protein n=1 Tax=Vulcaniibacterium thermophilum TaxID=1169913 RepID=A0A919D9H1_9GAMM|nr:DUF1801 domain-containing protein [Vulcaniibacterium thermophilum]GHE25925.1 hypothetical protein GCM10007167_03670 [Vulcaniibacterium thermophilum]